LTLGGRTVRLYPIFHPAAALYTPRMLETLREDFSRLPELLAMPEPAQGGLEEIPLAQEPPVGGADTAGGRASAGTSSPATECTVDQLDLF
jgi:hypothetical protein